MSSVVLQPVKRRRYWCAELSWPSGKLSPPWRTRRRRFGRFKTKEEAEKWIEEHRWLTAQSQLTVCGGKRAPAWAGDHIGFAPFPVDAMQHDGVDFL